mgnify:CR=1 FL=1
MRLIDNFSLILSLGISNTGVNPMDMFKFTYNYINTLIIFSLAKYASNGGLKIRDMP